MSDSLGYVHSLVAERLGLPSATFEEASDILRSRRVIPGVFGRYYKLVLAVQNQDYDEARQQFVEICAAIKRPPSFKVETFSATGLGGEKALYDELLNPAEPLPWMCPPPPDEGLAERVNEALALLAIACPPLADEVRGLVIEIVAASQSPGPEARAFGSVSSFMLWGLVLFNVERHKTAVSLVPCLVHEAAHHLLFAHSIEEPLVLNDINARYKSPLRVDPRPMDGVFHATFVAARMYYAVKKLREAAASGLVPFPEDSFDRQIASFRDQFFGGLSTVREFGELTATGRMIIDETVDYMQVQ